MSDNLVRFEVANHVAWVTLAREEVMNAVDAATERQLQAIWTEIERNTSVRAVVLTGSGERAFCAGADMKSPGGASGLQYWATPRPGGFGGIALRDTLDIPVIAGAPNADPAAVAHDAIAAAEARGAKWLFVDTAGRLHTKSNLMAELQKVHRVIGKKCPGAPHETLLVLDGSTGQNAVEQARHFQSATSVNALAITKLDGTAKGGVVMAVAHEFNIPVKFIGVGEKMEDLLVFDKEAFVNSLFSLDESNPA